MRNIKLEIEYEGTDYCGWQVQRRHKHKRSIQGTLEKTLQKILQEKIKLIAAGRTDAGVHAKGQVANFKTKSKMSLKKLQWALNGNLPNDITITKVKRVNPDFHSRFSAKSKLYCYRILNRIYPCAFLRNTVYFYPRPLDIKLMQRQAGCLLGRHDFRSFCARGNNAKDTLRTIRHITIKRIPEESSLITLDIEADGFLYNMVRNIVGTLIEIGRGKFPEGSLSKILRARNRRLAGPTAPARGLCLLKVIY